MLPDSKDERTRLLANELQEFTLRHRDALESCMVVAVWLPRDSSGPHAIIAGGAGTAPTTMDKFIAVLAMLVHGTEKLAGWHAKEHGIDTPEGIKELGRLINEEVARLDAQPSDAMDSIRRKIDFPRSE